MSATLPPAPTVADVLSLVSRIPPKLSQATPVSHLLQPFVSLCNEEWIRDFLFTPDAIELSHMVSPILPSTAFTCTLSTTRVAAPTVLPDPLDKLGDSQHIAGFYLFVPAFSADGTTLGFGVLDGLMNSGDFWLPNCQYGARKYLYTFRFVRDSRTRMMLEVFDLKDEGAVIIFFTRHLSSRRTQSCQAIFLRQQLLDVVNGGSWPLTAEDIVPALFSFQVEEQKRSCPVCHGPAEAQRHCDVPKTKPAHPFDMGHFASDMTYSLGEYLGVSSKRGFCQGVEHRHIAMGTRVVLQAFRDPSVVLKLSSVAVKKYMGGFTEDPRMSVMLNTPTGQALQVVGPPAWCDETDCMSTWTRTQEDDTSFVGVPSSLFAASSCQSPSKVICSSSTVGNDRGEEEWWNSRCSYTADEMQDILLRSALEVDKEKSSKEADGRSNGTSTIEDALPISMDHDDNSNLAKDPKIIEKRRKAQERKARNRASAHRSNLRTKAIRDGLLSELKVCREKVEQLRARELMLRQENLKLRKAKTDHA